MGRALSAPRTVTVHTVDHGLVTMPEPAWCVGHEGDRPGHRVDLGHRGPAQDLDFGDHRLWSVLLVQAPFTTLGSRQTAVHVEQTGYAGTLDPAELDALAAALVEHAVQLRAAARQLGVTLKAEGNAQ